MGGGSVRAFSSHDFLYNRKVLRTSLLYKKPSGRDAHSREWKMLPFGNRARRENSTLWNSFSYVFIFIMEKKETFVYNERNKNNEVKLNDERKGRSMYLIK